MLCFYVLLVNSLRKVRTSINRIVIGQEKDEKDSQKDVSFDILSLTNQLYRFKYTDNKGSEHGKIYLSENQVSDLMN